MKFKEFRKIFARDLRNLCIEKDWYTCGDNEEYSHLLYDLAQNKETLTTDDIIEIATDIMKHSDFPDCLKDEYTIEGIAFDVASIATTVFTVVKEED